MKLFGKIILLTTLILTFCNFAYAQSEETTELKPSKTSKKIKKKTTQKKGRQQGKFKFRHIDLNNDREISLDEFVEHRKLMIEKEFDRHDRNQDGVIDRKEFLVMKKVMRKRMEEMQKKHKKASQKKEQQKNIKSKQEEN